MTNKSLKRDNKRNNLLAGKSERGFSRFFLRRRVFKRLLSCTLKSVWQACEEGGMGEGWLLRDVGGRKFMQICLIFLTRQGAASLLGGVIEWLRLIINQSD